jgi:hypothetical protein
MNIPTILSDSDMGYWGLSIRKSEVGEDPRNMSGKSVLFTYYKEWIKPHTFEVFVPIDTLIKVVDRLKEEFENEPTNT